MISDGNSLVIINQKSNQYYRYPLKKTGLNFILDKNYLINQIKNLKGRIIDEKYYNFTLINNEIKINIFFDNKSLNLIGWQTEDIYQNLVITFISSIKINQKIKKNKFTLPKIK
jgi:outer membrane lipoprotein-sorting protein